MMFNKNDERAHERVLYKAKPNMFLGCKKAIYGVVLLAIVFIVSSMVIQFIGEMQVYLISQIKLPLTRYTAIAFFVVILIIILYIIWQLLKWYSLEYTLTDTRIIIKSGLLSTKKSYMPYTAIQDINTSQGILARLFDVGTVSVFSAYDNNLMRIENISNPSKVEDIIFSNMMNRRNFQEPSHNYIERDVNRNYSENNYNDDFDDYYDEFEPITPINHENNSHSRKREYEYYPEEFNYSENNKNTYEYEPYDSGLDYKANRTVNNSNKNIKYESRSDTFSDDGYYNEVKDNYSDSDEDYYQNNEPNFKQDDVYEKDHEEESQDTTSETVIKRHFEKFKK